MWVCFQYTQSYLYERGCGLVRSLPRALVRGVSWALAPLEVVDGGVPNSGGLSGALGKGRRGRGDVGGGAERMWEGRGGEDVGEGQGGYGRGRSREDVGGGAERMWGRGREDVGGGAERMWGRGGEDVGEGQRECGGRGRRM